MYANNLDDAFSAFALGTTDEWIKSDRYMMYPEYRDEEYTYIEGRTIGDITAQISVQGEAYSQYISFMIDRYYDGIDLIGMSIWIHYELKDGSGSEDSPVNVMYNDSTIRFGWVIPDKATQQSGDIKIGVWVNGTAPNTKAYILKTEEKIYTIHPGLIPGSGITQPDQTWFENFVEQMDSKVLTAQGHANDAQASKTAAAGSAAESAQSAAASAKALEDNRAYVESQKETFVGYNKRETDLKYANALIGTASGMGRVTVGDAWEAPVTDMDISGRSEQFSTTGAQLFDASKLVLNNAEAEISESGRIIKAIGKSSVSSTLSYKIDIKQVAGKTVYLQGDQVSKGDGVIQMQFMIKAADGKYRYATSNPVIAKDIVVSAAITTDDAEVNLLLYCNKKSDDDNVVLYENVRVGIAESAWEPYTGGKPSPSPEYPQPIISTGTVSTGAQLFDVNTIQSTQGVTWSASDDSRRITVTGSNAYARAYCEVPIKSVQGQTVTLSGTITSQSNPSGVVKCQIVITNAQDVMQYYPLVDNHVTVAVPVDSKRLEVGLFVNNGGAALNPANTVIFSDIMLNAGTTALPWEPYTGGKPSPSPEYPQPLDVTVTGEQLLDLKTRIGSQSQNGITLTVNADGSVAVSGTATSDATFILSSSSHMSLDVGKDYAIRGYGTDFDNNFFWQCWTKEPSGVFKDTGLGATFLYTQESEFNFAVLVKSGKTVNATFWPMLNEGTSPKPWQPYQSCTATITLTEPLHGIGDVRDRIMCRDGVWGIERQTAQIILNGSENWIVSNTGYANKNRFWYGGYENVIKHENDPDVAIKILCDKLTGEASGDTYRCTDGISSNVAGRIMVYIDDCSAGGADSFKVYLASNPITAIFERATPTWEPLPSDTQSAINALTTYTGTTHVTITAGGVEPDVGLGYVQDTQAVIAELKKLIEGMQNAKS